MYDENEEILDRPIPYTKRKLAFRYLFYIASTFLILRFIFYNQGWPYSNYLLLASGFFYVLFSLMRLIYQPKKNLFQIYSYIFFMVVIPGFILDYLYIPGGDLMLNIATLIPVAFFIHLLIKRSRRRSSRS